MKVPFKQIVMFYAFFTLAACGGGGGDSPLSPSNVGDRTGLETAPSTPTAGDPALTPENPITPTQPTGPANPPTGNNPTTGNPFGGSGIRVNEGILSGIDLNGLQVQVMPNPTFQTIDETIGLNEIFNVTPLTNESEMITFDPLADINPQAGTMRFVRSPSFFINASNFLEVNFNVRYPSRTRPDAQGVYHAFYPVDWIRFTVLACNGTRSCREILSSIPSQEISGPCLSNSPSCELNFHAQVPGSRITGGGVEKNDFYIVRAEGTEAADYRDTNGNARLCADSLQDCTYDSPYCVAGICSAVRGGDFYRADTPADLRALGRRN